MFPEHFLEPKICVIVYFKWSFSSWNMDLFNCVALFVTQNASCRAAKRYVKSHWYLTEKCYSDLNLAKHVDKVAYVSGW